MPAHRTLDCCRLCHGELTVGNWRASMRRHITKVCRACEVEYNRRRNAKAAGYFREYYQRNVKPVFDALRAEALAAYGGRCTCCGESIPDFLTIDHVAGGGNAHRRSLPGGGYRLYQWLKAHAWPTDGFRLLCMQCNWGRRHHPQGLCPHETQPIATSFPWAA